MDGFEHPAEGYVFIVTYGRSGSTLLQNIVNAIPGCQIRGENNNALFGLFKSWRSLATSPDIARMLREGQASDAAHPWFGAEDIDADAYRAALCRTFSRLILRPGPGVTVSGFKEIRTIADPDLFAAYLTFLQTSFPKARLVFNTRDPDGVCRSSWWRQHDPAQVRAMIRAAEGVFRAHVAAHPSRAVMLRYDEYIADSASLDPLFALLGARPTPQELQLVMQRRLTHAT